MTQKRLQQVAWGLTGLVSLLALVAWWQVHGKNGGDLSAYSFFPLLGLLAFSIMWAHYIISVVRQWFGYEKSTTELYFNITSIAVLVLILLHPGILAWSLWRDGLGLPPGSTKLYVGAALYGYVVMGVIALTIFLVYELRRIAPSKKWRKVLQYASDAAMLLIVVHGFQLGMVTHFSWFTVLWWFYAVSLTLSLGLRSYLETKA